jgi:F0F1-type ATP synthase membrane subunit c/vacuolar-type H+-ATPase subunit K
MPNPEEKKTSSCKLLVGKICPKCLTVGILIAVLAFSYFYLAFQMFKSITGAYDSYDVNYLISGLVVLAAAVLQGYIAFKAIKKALKPENVKKELSYSIITVFGMLILINLLSFFSHLNTNFSSPANTSDTIYSMIIFLVEIAGLVFGILTIKKGCDLSIILTSLALFVSGFASLFTTLNNELWGYVLINLLPIALGVFLLIMNFSSRNKQVSCSCPEKNKEESKTESEETCQCCQKKEESEAKPTNPTKNKK